MVKFNKLFKKIKENKHGKKITAAALSGAIVLGVVAPAAVLFVKANSYLPMPDVGEAGYKVMNLEDMDYPNNSIYSVFDRSYDCEWATSNRGFYELDKYSGSLGGLHKVRFVGYRHSSWPMSSIGIEESNRNFSVSYKLKTSVIQSDMLEMRYVGTKYDGKVYKDFESNWSTAKYVSLSGDQWTIISNIYVALGDRYKPGSRGWTYSVTDNDPQYDNQPIIWLDAGEMLRPTNQQISLDDLANVKVKLTLDNANMREVYDKVDVIAYAVALDNEDGKIGFRITDEDWLKITRKEYETATGITYGATYIIVSVTDASTYDDYILDRLDDYGRNMASVVEGPVVDLAGNPLALPENKNVAAQGLYIDASGPFVTRIEMSGSSLADVEPDENGTVEIEDATQLISRIGDTVDADVIISEKLKTDTISNNLRLEWSIKDKNGNTVTTSLVKVDNAHRESVNSDYVTRLDFAPLVIREGMTVSGELIKPIRLINAQSATDSSDNHLAESGTVDFVEEGTAISKQTYLDLEGPAVEVVQSVKQVDSETGEIHIIAELNVSDGVSGNGKLFAGIERKGDEPNGFLYVKGYNGDAELPFKYAFTDSMTLTDDVVFTDANVGENQLSALKLANDGTYFMHVILNETEGVEIDNDKGIEINFRLKDAVENENETSIEFDKLDIDDVAPTVAITQALGVLTPNSDETSTQRVIGYITAEDVNGILAIDCKWGENGTWENLYTYNEYRGFEDKVEVTALNDITGSGTVTETLYVRVTDAKSDGITANKQTEATSVYVLDLNRVNANYTIVGDPTVPDGSINVKVFEPEYSGFTEGTRYTRAVVTVADVENYVTVIKNYVRIFDSYTEDGTNLFGEGTWYRVDMTGGDYGTYQSDPVEESPDWTRYGTMTVQFAASMNDLTPVKGAYYNSTEDATLHESEAFTVCYAPKNDGVHKISNVTVRNNLNEVQTATEKTYEGEKYTYYKFDISMDGVRYHYNLNNSLIPGWKSKDVNVANSYAVLIKLDSNGNPMTDDNGDVIEVTDRVALSKGEEQTFAISGNNYDSGLYALQVYVEQKAGGKQTFVLDPIMLDAATAPTSFGLPSYTPVASIDSKGGGVSVAQEAPEGEYLNYVTVGAAKRDEYTTMVDKGDGYVTETYVDNRELVKIGNNPIYLSGSTNSLDDNGNTSFSFYVNLDEDKAYETYFGERVGYPRGIRIWNAASTGDPTTASVTYAFREVSTGAFCTDVTVNLSYDSIPTAEELAAANVADGLKLTTGENTVCYQIIMTNGETSSVRQIKVNVDTEAPEADFGFNFNDMVYEKSYDSEGNEIVKGYADSVEAYLEAVSYDDPGVKIYFASFGYSSATYKEVEDINSIPLDNSNGYLGKPSAVRQYSQLTEAICVVDSSGNARVIYPILTNEHDEQNGDYKNNAANEYPFGVGYWFLETGNYGTEDGITYTIRNLSYSDYVYEGVPSWAYGYSLAETVEYFTVQIDDNAPVTIWADPADSRNNFASAETGGVVGYERIVDEYSGTYDDIKLIMPYDSEVAEGEDVEHTVNIIFYNWEKENGERETIEFDTTITAPNTKPVITQNTSNSPSFGKAPLTANTYVDITAVSTEEYSLSPIFPAYNNGEYEIEFTDKFGRHYVQTLDITGFGTNPSIAISETGLTCKPVTVTVSCTDGISSVDEDTLPAGTQVTGNSTAELKIVLKENAKFDITYGDAAYPVEITNINTTPIVPKAVWIYDSNAAEEIGSVDHEIAVVLVDENGSTLIDPDTGRSVQYTFVSGGETSHTFSGYVNEYGMVGPDFTVEVPTEITIPELPTTKNDDYKPDVAVGAFVTYNNKTNASQNYYKSVDETRPEDSLVYLNELSKNALIDMDEFIKSLGWAEKYAFTIDVADENATKLFITTDIYGDVPKYDEGTSETIDGVSLMGRSLVVTKNVTFALHVVDSENNVNSVLFDIQSLGEGAPVPEYAQMLTKSGDAVRLYLIPPVFEGITNFEITNVEPVAVYEDDKDSIFYGCPYLSYSFAKDTEVVVYYSYNFNSMTYTGEIKTTIKAIDATVPYVESEKWSANYDVNGEKLTNKDISVQLKFDKDLSSLVVVNEAGEEISAPEGISISNLEDRVTVTFEQNTSSKLYLKATATVNKKQTVIELPVISTIDKVPPVVNATVEYSENHRSAIVTFTADEIITLGGVSISGKTISRTVTEAGAKTYNIFDAAGNVVRMTVHFPGLITENLNLTIGIKGTDGMITIIDNPEEYDIKVGDTFYAKVNRDSTIRVSQATTVNAPANEWVMLTVEADSAGLYPTVYAVDAYGNSAIAQFAKIPLADYLAPTLIIDKGIISASIELSDEEIKALLRDNMAASDNRTASDKLIYEFEYVRTVGKNSVIYKVTDEAGNTTLREGWIRFYDGNEARIKVNGEIVERDSTIIVEKGNQDITVEFTGEPYKLEWEQGKKTAGNLKTGAVSLTNGYSQETNKTYQVSLNDSGYYTFLLTTQGRDVIRFVFYVE